ncbi:MAG: hypothetical protein ACE15E_23220 [Acidobacteriota bacterium]
MEELRRYSTRATITSASFKNEYNWGDFKGNPKEWVRKYFDAFLYFANWGTRHLSFKIPASLLSLETAREYCSGDILSIEEHGRDLIVNFELDGEGENDYFEGGWSLACILPVRNELCRGDFRALYIGWLLGAQLEMLDEDDVEPTVPANLQRLSPALDTLADFLCLDRDLLAAAAQASPNVEGRQADLDRARSWIATLPSKTKDDFLLRVMEGLDAHVGNELWGRMRRETTDRPGQIAGQSARMVGELLQAADRLTEERRREQARKAAQARALEQQEEARKRKQHLDALTGREEELCARVHELVAIRQAKPYAEAVNLLVDLRDLAKRASSSDFSIRLTAFRTTHSNKPALLARLLEAGL